MKYNVLYLYAEVMPYTESVIDAMINNYDVNFTLIEATYLKLTPYVPNKKNNYVHLSKSTFENKKKLLDFCINNVRPNVIYVSGWMDKDYLYVTKHLKKMGLPIVTGIDTQWRATFRQRLASLLSPFLIKPYFTHIWVAGNRQYEYATKLGFKRDYIIHNLYSSNTKVFKNINLSKTKNILFVGRLVEVKGYELLIRAFLKLIKDEQFQDWTLTLVGSGKDATIPKNSNIKEISFSTPEELAKYATDSLIFCLPSTYEPWGVVVHEFASCGLSLLLSDECGAGDTFLIHGYNGYVFKSNNEADLLIKLRNLMQKETSELVKMGMKSRELSQRISPDTSAAAFMSVVLST